MQSHTFPPFPQQEKSTADLNSVLHNFPMRSASSLQCYPAAKHVSNLLYSPSGNLPTNFRPVFNPRCGAFVSATNAFKAIIAISTPLPSYSLDPLFPSFILPFILSFTISINRTGNCRCYSDSDEDCSPYRDRFLHLQSASKSVLTRSVSSERGRT